MDDDVPSVNVKRSQAILRMPVDMVDAVMILHDGERADVILFVPPTEDVTGVFGAPGFIAVARGGAECLVARDAIACLGVPASRGPRLDDDLPVVRQQVLVKLRSGVAIEGELRWIAPPGQQRTTDHLNVATPYLALHAGDTVHLVAKAHVAMVIEA